MVLLVISGVSVIEKSHATQKVEVVADNVEATAKALQYLMQYEIDYSYILSQAVDGTSNTAIREKLLKSKEQAETNIKHLAELVTKYGRTPPTYSRDFKGFFMQGYTALRGIATDKGMLRALHSNTVLVLNAYENTLKSDLPGDVRSMVQRILDEKREMIKYLDGQI